MKDSKEKAITIVALGLSFAALGWFGPEFVYQRSLDTLSVNADECVSKQIQNRAFNSSDTSDESRINKIVSLAQADCMK